MTLDPSLRRHQLSDHVFTKLADIEVDPATVYAFDFDGVIASSADHSVYRLPPAPSEAERLAEAACIFGIRCGQMELGYQRHLLHQAAAWKLGLPIGPGPGLDFAKRAAAVTSISVLTARSGWYAVDRVRQFLQAHGLIAVDTFHVGRTSKDLQVQLLAREFPHAQIVYVEDSVAHLETALQLGLPNLQLVLCPDQVDEQTTEALREQFYALLEEAMRVW